MTDKQLHDEVLAELECEPEVHPERIGVSVEDGVVALSGHVDSYAQKLAAERVVKRVYSAKAVVNDLEVALPARDEVTDLELAHAAVTAVENLSQVPPDTIRVTVRDGQVTLEGKVEWHYQRQAAERAIHHLRGVRGVTNHVTLSQAGTPTGVRERILSALHRAGELDGRRLSVEAVEGRVTLEGEVPNLHAREEAEWAAWRIPGVTWVENRLKVQHRAA